MPQRPLRNVPLCNSPAPEGAKRRRLEPVCATYGARTEAHRTRSRPHESEEAAKPTMSREPNRARASRIRPNRAGPHRAESDRADRTGANRSGSTEPKRTASDRTEPEQAGPNQTDPSRIGTSWTDQTVLAKPKRTKPNRAETDRIEPERAVSARTETHPLRLGLPDQVALKTTGQTHGTSVRARTMEHDRPQAILLHQMVEHVFERPSMQTETSRKLFGSVRLAALERRANANHHANRLPRIRPFPPRSSARHRASIHRQRSGLAQTPQLQTPECASCPCRAPNGPRASPHRRIV